MQGKVTEDHGVHSRSPIKHLSLSLPLKVGSVLCLPRRRSLFVHPWHCQEEAAPTSRAEELAWGPATTSGMAGAPAPPDTHPMRFHRPWSCFRHSPGAGQRQRVPTTVWWGPQNQRWPAKHQQDQPRGWLL